MSDTFPALAVEAEKFKAWRDTHFPLGELYGEWEEDYPDWDRIYSTFLKFLRDVPFQLWNQEIVNTVLYIIARNNEPEYLVSEFSEDPERLLFLAEAGLHSSERDAKWQLIKELGELTNRTPEVESLLKAYAQDEDEYVRRQALMNLGRIKSSAVEEYVADAWNTGHEYQRMAVLSALRDLHSPLLSIYLEKAEADGRKHLAEFADKIRRGVVD
ncbi:MAG: HEAT repeat domain-containing protein [Armatimonadetes bacterium]|nr:HEAT repeat domain-containing protein [Armatimonadota bacterium]